MQRMIMLASAVAAVLSCAAPAEARQGPWCARVSVGSGSVQEICHFASMEACRNEVIAGNRGFCTQNPRWPGYYGMAEPRHHKRYRHHSARY